MPVRNHRRAAPRRAFTLIELLIVIAILLALFGIVAGTLMSRGEQADVDLQKIQFDMLEEQGLKMFKLDVGRYPTTEEGLEALWDKTILETEEDEQRWKGPYLEEKVTEDKWGNEIIYNSPSELVEGAPYDLISFGPDGEEDTEDDITNHKTDAEGEFETLDDFSIEGESMGGE